MGDIVLFVTGISHNPSLLFLMPCKTIFLFFITANSFFVSKMLQSSSHNWSKEISEALPSFGKICANLACLVKLSANGSSPCSVLEMYSLFGNRTSKPFEGVMFSRHILSCGRQ